MVKNQFYIYDDDRQRSDDSLHQSISIPKRMTNRETSMLETSLSNTSLSPLKFQDQIRLESPVMTLKDRFNNKNDILKFPVESSHSYSYAHLSPNSLALRLNVLRRSLEILKERPGLLNAINKQKSSKSPLSYTQNSQRAVSANNYNVDDYSNNRTDTNDLKLPNAYLRPQMKRSDSFPVDQIYSQSKQSKSLKLPKVNEMYSSDLKDIVQLLELNDVIVDVTSKNKDFASTLHDLALTRDETGQQMKYDIIKSRLMYALSTPFVDTSVMTTTNDNTPLSPSLHASTVALNLLNSNNNNINSLDNFSGGGPGPGPGPGGGFHERTPTFVSNSGAITPVSGNSRPFHSISSGKHALPQSVFTIDYEAPWAVKAANDLACLMFGVLKNMIRSLTLMDLIAPQFREFVTDRLSKSVSGVSKIHSVAPNTDIIFAGEIVAISRPGDKGYAWTSLWAKHKGNLIIFMFDQIPCDAIDLVIQKDLESSGDGEFKVVSVTNVAGSLIREDELKKIDKLSTVSESINSFLHHLFQTNLHQQDDAEIDDVDLGESDIIYDQSEQINIKRYFTLQLIENENIPCAVTSNPIDINPGKLEMKLKIHSLPYIAGIFVIDSKDFKIISCNNAIARNLFGRSSLDLTGKSIDTIIENFHDIYNVGVKDMSDSFSIVPGLVLPEHFFRKYDSIVRYQSCSEDVIEENFIKSKGLVARHIDGHDLCVDVQLRVSALDTYVLWITYSRPGTKRSASEEEYSFTSKNTNDTNLARPQMKRARLISGGVLSDNDHGFTSLPSQLNLFDHDLTLPTVGDITRHNSTRTPKAPNSGSRISSGSNATTEDSVMSDTAYSTLESHMSLHKGAAKEYEEHKLSEEDLLREEDMLIKQKSAVSKYWPKQIGDARRSKKIDEFNIVRDMGEGAYGKVVLAQHKEDKPYEVIIKCIDKERILVDTWVRDRKLGTIPSEIQIMSTLMKELHPNIMRIIDFFEDEQYYYLETPIFGNPPAIDLFDYIEVKKDMTEHECQFIFKQIVLAVFHLHRHGIVHRDIKDENVIVDERGIIKLIDFGSAGYSSLGPFDVFVGTIDYASPEVLRGEKYEGKPQDIWALGILLYTILYKENPFYNVDEIMEGNLRLPPVISEAPTRLIEKILTRDIARRPTITDILEDNWLQ